MAKKWSNWRQFTIIYAQRLTLTLRNYVESCSALLNLGGFFPWIFKKILETNEAEVSFAMAILGIPRAQVLRQNSHLVIFPRFKEGFQCNYLVYTRDGPCEALRGMAKFSGAWRGAAKFGARMAWHGAATGMANGMAWQNRMAWRGNFLVPI